MGLSMILLRVCGFEIGRGRVKKAVDIEGASFA